LERKIGLLKALVNGKSFKDVLLLQVSANGFGHREGNYHPRNGTVMGVINLSPYVYFGMKRKVGGENQPCEQVGGGVDVEVHRLLPVVAEIVSAPTPLHLDVVAGGRA